jgi:hypothetical protein
MPDNDIILDRHCELWKEHDKQVARWVFWSLIFAIVLQHKVLIPYTGIPKQQASLLAALHDVQTKLQETQAEGKVLKDSEARLTQIKRTIQETPWAGERENLRAAFRDLQQCVSTVRSMSRDEVLAKMDELSRRLRTTQVSPEVQALPTGPNPLALPTPAINESPSPNGIPRALPNAAFDPSQLPLNVLRPVANMPLVPATPNAPGISNSADELSSELRAILILALDIDSVKAAKTDQQFATLLERQRAKQLQTFADETVKRVAHSVDELVIKPLEDLPGDMPEISKLRADITQWERDHIGAPEWYETVSGKGATIAIVGNQATQQTDALMRAFSKKETMLEQHLAELSSDELVHKQKIEELAAQGAKLETRMQKLLPEWLQELVSADQMLQLYPVALLGLLLGIGLHAFRVRTHYLVVRDSYEYPELSVQDPAVSSLWTLVYRGPRATTLTASAYLASIGILWCYFYRGSRLLGDWLTSSQSTAWGLSKVAVPWTTTLGHLVFTLAALSVIVVLIRERANALKRHQA